MNKTVRLVVLAVLALALTCLCLAQPARLHRNNHSNCVPRCEKYCRSLGLLARVSCKSCTCYSAGGGCYGGCYGGGCYGGGCSGGCYGGCNGGCDGCGGGGCGGGGCGGC